MSRYDKYLGQAPAAPVQETTGNRYAKYAAEDVPPHPRADSAGIGEKLDRQAGIAARATLTGLSFPVSLLADTAVLGVNAATGKNLRKPSEGFQDSLTRMGVPAPQNAGERLASDVMAGASGGVLGGPVAALSGATGSFSAGVSRELGGGPFAQTVWGIIGGMTPTNATNAFAQLAKYGLKKSKDIFNPANREVIGRILVQHSDDPEAVIKKLGGNIPEYVPGSRPTVGEVAGDNRLTAAQAAFENNKPQLMADIRQSNTAARNAYLDDIAGTPAQLDNAVEARSRATSRLRNDAFNNRKGDVDPKKVIEAADQVLASPSGNLSNVQTAMNAAKARIQEAINIDNPEYAYALRRDLANDIAGRLAQKAGGVGTDPKKYQRLADGYLADVLKVLDDQIEQAAPGYKGYMQEYVAQSRPINQMEALQDIQEAAFKGQPFDARGNQAMRPSAIDKALSTQGRAQLERVLTPEQMTRLENLQRDLQRQSVMRSVRPQGSPTAANLKASEALDGVIDDLITRNLDRIPLVGTALKTAKEGAVERGLANAYSNPQEAREAMIAALKSLQGERVSVQMKRVALQSILGTSIGVLTPKQASLILDGKQQSEEAR